jgi:hypothetical protein
LRTQRDFSVGTPKFISTEFQRLITPSPISKKKLVAAATKNHRSTMSIDPALYAKLTEAKSCAADPMAVHIECGINPFGRRRIGEANGRSAGNSFSFERFMLQPRLSSHA